MVVKIRYLNLLGVLVLVGCAAPNHLIVKNDTTPFISGVLVLDQGKNNRLELQTSNHRYESHELIVERNRNLAELYTRYHLTNPKLWMRISSGLDHTHDIYFIDTVVQSNEESRLNCHIEWRLATKPKGVCKDSAGVELPVRFD